MPGGQGRLSRRKLVALGPVDGGPDALGGTALTRRALHRRRADRITVHGGFRSLLVLAGRRSSVGARALVTYDRHTDQGRALRWEDATALLVMSEPVGVSVDVFDTVLTRRVIGDDTLWWIVGTAMVGEGAWSGDVRSFVHARCQASRLSSEASLDDIYKQTVLSDRCRGARGPTLESRVERELTIPVHGAREALERLRTTGHRLTFVSDMHLPEAHLAACLAEHGLSGPEDGLVISSIAGAAKWTGELFPMLRRGASGQFEWHIGNDLWADVAMAERAGVRALPLRSAEPTSLERCMAGSPGSVGAALAGAALRVRARGPREGRADPALWEVGADVAGQCLAAFLLWVRGQCEQAGAQQVLFLARDGELPLRMAEAMPDDHWSGRRLTYVHGSRRLWSVAAAAVLGVDAWLAAGTADRAAFLRQDENHVPWASLLGRVGLGAADLDAHPSLQDLAPDDVLPTSMTSAWLAMLDDVDTRLLIEQRARRQYVDLRQHLEELGIPATRLAVVDVGWRGQLAWHVSAVLRGFTGFEPVHLHFGGVDVAVDQAEAIDVRRFAIDDSRAPLPFPDIISCVETLTASGGQRARSLDRGPDGQVRLVFAPALPEMDTEHRRLMWLSAVEVARELPSRVLLDGWGLHTDALELHVRDVLSEFWLRPTRAHAIAGQHLAAEVDDSGAGVHPVVRPYSLLDRGRPGMRTWRQGSLRLTSPLLASPLAHLLRRLDHRRRPRT